MSHQTVQTIHPDSESFAAPDDTPRIAISEDGQIVYASPSFCTLSHIPEEEITSADLDDVISLKNFETIKSGVQSVKINGHPEQFEFHFDWLQTQDKKRYLIGSQTKTEAQPAEDIYLAKDIKTFFNVSKDAMAILNKKGKVLRANDVFRDLQSAGGPLDLLGIYKAEDKITQLGEGWYQWTFKQKGTEIFASGANITAIKTQQEALERREKQLSEAESIGRMGHWYWTIGEETLQWSPEIYKMFGVEEGAMAPTILGFNDMIHASDAGRINQVFQRAIIEGKDYEMDFRAIQPNGDIRYIRCEGRCARDDEDDVIALYGIMQDMTERVLYEEQLRAAKDSAERAYAAKTQFLANMSHELRTPLNAIIGFSEMMQRQLLGPIGSEKYLEYIGGIRESGEHLLDLISDILDMSKIEAGKYELDLEEVNVKKTIGMAVHMMEGRALEAEVKISTKGVANENLLIVADRRAFMQIMLNLLSNAVKFSGESKKIEVEAHEREDYLAIKIIDHGIGIPANKLAQITRPFEQVSSSYTREHDGSGLGLAITKELAELHGGALRIDSTVDEGTVVTVRLPYDAFKATRE